MKLSYSFSDKMYKKGVGRGRGLILCHEWSSRLRIHDWYVCCFQFLVGSAHILKQPLFHQACESAFTACDGDGKNYIMEKEVLWLPFGLFDSSWLVSINFHMFFQFGDSLMLSIPGLSNNEVSCFLVSLGKL